MATLTSILLKLLGLIPFPMLYLLSDVLQFLVFRVLGYRKKVIRENLKNSFPNYTTKQLRAIERASAKNFCDVMLENLKLLSIGPKELQKRMPLKNPEVLENLRDKQEGVLLISAHYNNWEWMALSLSRYAQQDVYGVYKPLNNSNIDQLMRKGRERFGAQLIPMNAFVKSVLKNKGQASINLMLADQSPHAGKVDYYCEFLNQDTPVFLGPEKLMKAAAMKMYFMEVHRIKRGFYEMKIVPLEVPVSEEKGAATLVHVRHLEKILEKDPNNWLWSHRRWKNSRKK